MTLAIMPESSNADCDFFETLLGPIIPYIFKLTGLGDRRIGCFHDNHTYIPVFRTEDIYRSSKGCSSAAPVFSLFQKVQRVS
jgi:hypothetical protein